MEMYIITGMIIGIVVGIWLQIKIWRRTIGIPSGQGSVVYLLPAFMAGQMMGAVMGYIAFSIVR